ncbi:unnamed protein product [Paramecium primaurelia]|uniref:Uncharacterized protein n=1 Tax=Paramecium primaurelia TaxID=5886 RepID=A0A8S1N7D2_PARPR|nr:unnamed protein product [Paramecium primaurelia]
MTFIKENFQRYYLIILAIKGNLTKKILEIKKSYQQQNKSNFFNGKANMGHTIKQQGKWIATWKGEIIQEVDEYYENELKLGQLKQPSKNYWRQCIQNSQAQLYEKGEYYLDQILGDGIISMITKLWMIINQFISRGESYDYGNGKIKISYWIDSHDRFSNYRQLAHNGRWEIEYRYDNNHPFSKMQKILINWGQRQRIIR